MQEIFNAKNNRKLNI